MTRHNLKEHLEWLLKLDPATKTNTGFELSPTSTTTPTVPISVVEQPPLVTDRTDLLLEDNAPPPQKDFEFVRPPLPARLMGGVEKDDMARLQSASKSGRKTQLMSQAGPKTVEPTTPSSRMGFLARDPQTKSGGIGNEI